MRVISINTVDAFYLYAKRVIRYGFGYTWNLEIRRSHSSNDKIKVFWDVNAICIDIYRRFE
jgi:hypothetical protein